MENHWRKGEAMHLVLQKRGFCNSWEQVQSTKEDGPSAGPEGSSNLGFQCALVY